jgi:hypothetical protein
MSVGRGSPRRIDGAAGFPGPCASSLPALRLRAVRSGLTICQLADRPGGPLPLANALGALWQRPGRPSTGRSAVRAGQSDPSDPSKIQHQGSLLTEPPPAQPFPGGFDPRQIRPRLPARGRRVRARPVRRGRISQPLRQRIPPGQRACALWQRPGGPSTGRSADRAGGAVRAWSQRLGT